jgi:hypothetical protein
MITRRQLLGFSVMSTFGTAVGMRRVRVGAMARVVALPSYFDWYGADTSLQFRLCLGKECRVIDFGEDGRPRLDVTEHVKSHFKDLQACSMSFEPHCVTAVRRG